jgi:hypothetical protein
MKYYVVTHRPLEWPLPSFMQPVSAVPAGEGVLDLSGEYADVPGRSEYATLFALRRHLQQSWGESGPPADEEHIGVAHYRRFPVTRPIGVPSEVYGVVSAEQFTQLPDDAFLPPPGSLLLSSVHDVGSMLRHYGENHVLRDLLHFRAIAIDLGVIDEKATAAFLSQGVMVTVPSIGVYPAIWYMETLVALERVVDAFESSVAVPRDGHQRQAVRFCCERLHSMLVSKLVTQWSGPVLATPALIVSDDGAHATGN